MNSPASLFYLEDDAALASATQRVLRKRGFVVRHFASLAEARSAAAEESYQLALLDLKLADGSGMALIEELVARFPAIRIVVLTGYASIATAVQAIKMGAVNYLSKPASIEQILNAFDEHASPPADLAAADVLPLRRLEWEHIQQALQDNKGNISATARQLKMHRRTLQRKLSKKPVAE